jgi:hypothetical protein
MKRRLTDPFRSRSVSVLLMSLELMTERLLSRARDGDEPAFRELTDPFRRELELHCYRILGSLQGRRRHAPGDSACGLAWPRRLRGSFLPPHLALSNSHQPLPQSPPQQRATTRQGGSADARAATADAPFRAALAPALPGHPPRRPARLRPRSRGALRDEGSDRAGVRNRAATAAAAAAHRARAPRHPRLLDRGKRNDPGNHRSVRQGGAPARAQRSPSDRSTPHVHPHRTHLRNASSSAASQKHSGAETRTPWSPCSATTPG